MTTNREDSALFDKIVHLIQLTAFRSKNIYLRHDVSILSKNEAQVQVYSACSISDKQPDFTVEFAVSDMLCKTCFTL